MTKKLHTEYSQFLGETTVRRSLGEKEREGWSEKTEAETFSHKSQESQRENEFGKGGICCATNETGEIVAI